MARRTRLAFLVLVVGQTLHSIEEFSTRLYENFAPARFVSGLVSDNPALGFVVINVCVVAFGYWSYFVPLRLASGSARGIAWAWAGVELANGLAHLALAFIAGGYFSGAATAPLLVVAATVLAVLLYKDGPGHDQPRF